jgi:hypothetical protein
VYRRRFLTLLGLATAWPLVAHAAPDGFRALPKSLWVWKTPLARAPEAAAFAHRHGFGTVFYSVPPAERGGAAKVASGLSAFRDRGIRVYAVAGSPAWARQPNLPRPLAELIELGGKGAFDGLCLDVEPHTLPAWRESRPELMAGYVAFMARASERAKAAGLSLCAATVPAYSNQPVAEGGTVMERVAKLSQSTALMAYRSDPERALKVARRSLDQLDGCKRPWWFGVTAKRDAPAEISYGRVSPATFKTALVSLDAGLRGRPGYLGIAVNDYLSLRELLEG